MFSVSGSNVHGQWLSGFTDDALIKFSTLQTSEILINIDAKINSINWAYNLFSIRDDYFITGAWAGLENAVIKVKIPEKCQHANNDLTLVGNDRKLFLCDAKALKLWVLNLPECEEDANNWNWYFKKLDFILQSEEDIYIKKIIVSNSDAPCILTSKGTVYEYPAKIDTSHCIGKVCDLECGYEHSILLTDAGRIYTWGSGKRCQLGHGDLTSLLEPAEVEALAGIKIIKISAGGWHCLALSENGDLYAWGWNDAGQLGVQEKRNDINERENILRKGNSCALPTLVDFYDTCDGNWLDDVIVKDIACGSRHSAVVLGNNSVWTTGMNKYGQLGFCPKQTPSLSFFKNAFDCESNCSIVCGPWCTVVTKI